VGPHPLPPDAVHQILDQLPIMISIFGPDGQLQAVNRAWELVLGWTHEELERQHIDILPACFPDPQELQRARAFIAEPQSGWVDFAPRGRDGQALVTTWTNLRLADGAIMCLGHAVGEPQPQAATERARHVAEIRAMRAQVQELARRLQHIQEEERQAIARDLDDQIGQTLAGIGVTLARLRIGLPTASRALLDQVEAAVRELRERVGDLALDLRPALLDEFGLQSALWWYRERVRARLGLHIDLSIIGLADRVAPVIELAAYRIIQEALTNVARHAGTKTVVVQLWRAHDTLRITIADHGRGFDASAAPGAADAAGLLGMQERAAALGGSLIIASTSGAGTQISASLPLTHAATPPERGEKNSKPQIGEQAN
jgi:PAS domain S-box-containing protein